MKFIPSLLKFVCVIVAFALIGWLASKKEWYARIEYGNENDFGKSQFGGKACVGEIKAPSGREHSEQTVYCNRTQQHRAKLQAGE